MSLTALHFLLQTRWERDWGAAGDVKFTVVWSLITTIGVRLLASVLFAVVFDMGVIGIALAMSLDWCVRAVVFYIRFQSGKWKKYQLI